MLDEVAGTKETVSDLGAGGGAKRLSPALVMQHAGQLRCEAVEVAWPDELTHEAVLGLIPDAATRLATTGRPLHIASATVRPNPSARLFCTTMSVRR